MPPRRPLSGNLTSSRTNWLTPAMGLLLVLCWMLGGVTFDETSADEVLLLAALPVLGWSAWQLSARSVSSTTVLALFLLLLVIALPLWQLLPLPQTIGMGGAARHGIAADLAVAGIPAISAHASLSTLATERALWSLLPAVALFLGALVLYPVDAGRLLQLVLALVLGSAAFAFFQLSLPNGSPLQLYTSWGRNFGGVFVNQNHQGNALALGAVIAAALFIDGRRRARADGGFRYWLYAMLSAACAVMVPLANGSAAMLLLMVGLVVVTVMMGALDLPSIRTQRSAKLGVAISVVMAVVVLASALAWKNVEEDRRTYVRTTVQIGQQFAPLGVGVGNFVPTYAQYAPPEQARTGEVNHAHNEYVQWWLEAGVPALVVMGFGIGLFAWLGWQVLRRMPSRRLRAIGAATWTSMLLLLMHSLVDYPLRTTTLMATAGLMAGLLFNAVNASKRPLGDDQDRDAASQRA